jgi:hypothetical protein
MQRKLLIIKQLNHADGFIWMRDDSLRVTRMRVQYRARDSLPITHMRVQYQTGANLRITPFAGCKPAL